MNLSRDYIKLSLEDFGRQLIETNDLDPVYAGLNQVFTPANKLQLRRWLLSYWCCYHAGLASWLSESENRHEYSPKFTRTYWAHMVDMAENIIPSPLGDRWPRGRERRHFRGQKAVEAVRTLCQRYPEPEKAVLELEHLANSEHLAKGGPVPYEVVQKKVCEWPLFGPWIAFKVADMLERLLGVDIDFSKSGVLFYDSPRKAADLWVEKELERGNLFPIEKAKNHSDAAMSWLRQELYNLKAPPNYNRPLGVQEYETILCKWKAHQDGIYPVGIDTVELVHALAPWATISPTASRMLDVFTTRT